MQSRVISFPRLVRHENETELHTTTDAHAQISTLLRFAVQQ